MTGRANAKRREARPGLLVGRWVSCRLRSVGTMEGNLGAPVADNPPLVTPETIETFGAGRLLQSFRHHAHRFRDAGHERQVPFGPAKQ